MNNKKTGFSLMEALMAMLILSLFFIASSKVITRKQEVEFQRNPHGYYECYIMNGGLWEHRSRGSASTRPEQKDRCVFSPPTAVSYVTVHYWDGAQYYTSQQVIMNQELTLPTPSAINQNNVFMDDVAEYAKVQQESPEDFNNFVATRLAEFLTYLRLSQPTSNIYTNWEQSGILPAQAVLIAW